MTIREPDLHHRRRRFEPFRVHVADGKSYEVRHPDRIASLRGGRMVSDAADEGFVILDLLLVRGLEKPVPRGKGVGRRAS